MRHDDERAALGRLRAALKAYDDELDHAYLSMSEGRDLPTDDLRRQFALRHELDEAQAAWDRLLGVR